MIAIDHRQAPEPTYTVRSPSPRPILHTGLISHQKAQAQAKTLVTTPPLSPPIGDSVPQINSSLLSPAENYVEIEPGIRAISANQLVLALQHLSQQRLPSADVMFPWLHGLSPQNYEQCRFFGVEEQMQCPAPNVWRGISVVYHTQGMKQPKQTLIGSLEPRELLSTLSRPVAGCNFKNVDPLWGISLRNFGLQASKLALLSDLVVYRCGNTLQDREEALEFCRQLAEAQAAYRKEQNEAFPIYSTFLVGENFTAFEANHPDLIATSPSVNDKEIVCDFLTREREQMHLLTRATEISHNVFLGDERDAIEDAAAEDDGKDVSHRFTIHVRCEDGVDLPCVKNDLRNIHNTRHIMEIVFPSSSCLSSPSQAEVDELVNFCAWLYMQTHETNCDNIEAFLSELHHANVNDTTRMAHVESDQQSDLESRERSVMAPASTSSRGSKRVLLTCRDGYTETTFLALAYIIYSKCITLDDAWLYLHNDKKRDFYAFTEDLVALKIIFPALISACPHPAHKRAETLATRPATWFEGNSIVGWSGVTTSDFTGSLPSRILNHLYLGNIQHANNLEMLKAIGITRILSVGESPFAWHNMDSTAQKPDAHLYINALHDDGIDSLESEIEKCLTFIDEGLALGQKTLVHCRVGVSRSASICIAEVVRRRRLSIEDAYLFTRARRLNVIIQPNLRFMYELVKWGQEELSRDNSDADKSLVPRTIEWPTLCTQIAKLNRYYIQQR